MQYGRYTSNYMDKDKCMDCLSISDFLSFTACDSTRNTYRSAFKKYLAITLDIEINNHNIDEQWKGYIESNRDIISDLAHFPVICRDNKHSALSPKTVNLYQQVVILYLRECGIIPYELHSRKIKKHRPQNCSISKESELTHEILQNLICSADDRLRAEILIAVSSGMRIGEILNIEISNIDLSKRPAEFYLPPNITKNSRSRRVFISDEARRATEKWLEVRSKLDCYSRIRDDPRLFPYSPSNENLRLKNLLIKTGYYEEDLRTHRSTIHFHLFRKFFITEFKLAASIEVAEDLAGHKSYLSDSYRRLSLAEKRREYLKAEPRLTINIRCFTHDMSNQHRELYGVYLQKLENDIERLHNEVKSLITCIQYLQ